MAVYYSIFNSLGEGINVYKDSETERGGFCYRSKKAEEYQTSRWSLDVRNPSYMQTDLRNGMNRAKLITRCKARQLLRQWGLGHLEVF